MTVGPVDVAIVGGGVIGLSIAYLLSIENIRVGVFDRGRIGGEASWAGAGMISPHGDRPSPLPASRLRSLCARLHPEWAQRLLEETGIDNGYRRTGGIDVALSDQDESDLASAAGRWRDEGIVFEKLSRNDLPRIEPALGPLVRSGYFLPDLAQIRNPWHLRALQAAIRARGGIVAGDCRIDGLELDEHKVIGLKSGCGPIRCGLVVLAAGAWSGPILSGLGVRLWTPPIRGQMVLMNPGSRFLARIIEHGKRYLVPRDDGRILIGSTEEDVGYVDETTAETIDDLVGFAGSLCPRLMGIGIERAWAGLRPGSADTRPSLGPIPGFSNLMVATGHHRAGLQLAPGTATIIVDLIVGRVPSIDPRAFRVDRHGPSDPPSPATEGHGS